MTKTATFVKKLEGFAGDARLFRLSAPLAQEERNNSFEYVVVSAVHVLGRPETYIFGADGEIQDWGELDGSFQGALDHGKALRDAGYDVGAVR